MKELILFDTAACFSLSNQNDLIVQGQPRLSSKGNLAYPRPIFPKNNTEAKYTGKLSL